MLAKGLDFDNVSLVGIMNADNMLYHPDFRAFERFSNDDSGSTRESETRKITNIQLIIIQFSKLLLQIMRGIKLLIDNYTLF
jgi:primosomal protein N'